MPAVGETPDGVATWRVTADGDPVTVRSRAQWVGSAEAAPQTAHPLARLVRTAHVSLVGWDHVSELEVIRPEYPVLFFADAGRRLPAQLPLPADWPARRGRHLGRRAPARPGRVRDHGARPARPRDPPDGLYRRGHLGQLPAAGPGAPGTRPGAGQRRAPRAFPPALGVEAVITGLTCTWNPASCLDGIDEARPPSARLTTWCAIRLLRRSG